MVSIIVGIMVCADNLLIFFIIFRQLRRVPGVQHNGETLRPISRAKVWSNERFYVATTRFFTTTATRSSAVIPSPASRAWKKAA